MLQTNFHCNWPCGSGEKIFEGFNCSNWFRHGSTTINYPQCSLTFTRERYLHRCREQSFAIRAYAMSAVGIDVVSDHNGS